MLICFLLYIVRACVLATEQNRLLTVNIFMIHHTGQRMLTTPTVSSSGRIPAFLRSAVRCRWSAISVRCVH